MKRLARLSVFAVCTLIIGVAGGARLAAQVRYPMRPGDREFIRDEAGLIEAADQEKIRAACDKLLTEERVPIIVVTIKSLAEYGAHGLSIDAYARSLFDSWGIGSEGANYGVLLLVSVADRKARIELGESWAHTRDADAKRIMDGIIVPNFKAQRFSAGVTQGVQALDTLARGLVVSVPRPAWQAPVFLGLFALGVGIAVSLIRSGRTGWGWGLLAALAVIGVGALVGMFTGGGSSSGREYKGSSFGGGRGGGGGATGSW